MISTLIVQSVKSISVRTVKGTEVESFGIIDFDEVSVYINTPEQMEALAKKLKDGATTLRAMRGANSNNDLRDEN